MKLPGDKLASAMEYMPGNGVYEENGELFAGICGKLKEDNQKMMVSIEPMVSTPVKINEGDTVFGRIQSLRDSMVSVEILKVKDEKRSIGNYTVGTLHIAKMSSEYVSDVKKLYQINESPLHDPCVIAYLIQPSLFKGKLVNVEVEENSSLTRGETVSDLLGVTKRIPNCHVMFEANANGFFSLLKKELKKLN